MTTMNSPEIDLFTAKIGDRRGGSGCLIQPLSREYSYVLTAKHLLKDLSEELPKEEIKICRQLLKNGDLEEQPLKIIEIYRHPDADKDAAILKIEFIEGLESLVALDLNDVLENKTGYFLIGHPVIRRDQAFSSRGDELKIIRPVRKNYLEAQLVGNYHFDYVDGQSGGGVIKESDGKYFVAGVQASMAALDEPLGRVRIMPVAFFEEIIKENELSELVPAFEKSEEEKLLQNYRVNLKNKVEQVKLFKGASYDLDKVFVELLITAEYERPSYRTEWLGVMNAELRERRNMFCLKVAEVQVSEKPKEKVIIKPDELLSKPTQAFIIGSPGCGKTTLLKYLALQTLKGQERLPVFLELKSVTGDLLKKCNYDFLDLVFEKAVAVNFKENALPALRKIFDELLAEGRLAFFLDGLDEVSNAPYFNDLCRVIESFDAKLHNCSLIVTSRPYVRREISTLKEMEITAFDLSQIKNFLFYYFGKSDKIERLIANLERNPELLELARIPFLLSCLASLVNSDEVFNLSRLDLFNLIIGNLVVEDDDRRGIPKPTEIPDFDDSDKRNFLAQIAFERFSAGNDVGTSERLVFSREFLSEKARDFCRIKGIVNSGLFRDSIKKAPVIREVAVETYAFTHLTLQEYLAATYIVKSENVKDLFFKAYFDSVMVEMETLPMALGLYKNPDELYEMLEQMPDSLTRINLRLRARGLAYLPQSLNAKHLERLTDQLLDVLIDESFFQSTYATAVYRAFSSARAVFLAPIYENLKTVLENGYTEIRNRVIELIGYIGHEYGIRLLIPLLGNEENADKAENALRTIGGAALARELLKSLTDENEQTRYRSLELLSGFDWEKVLEEILKIIVGSNTVKSQNLVADFNKAIKKWESPAAGNELLVAEEHLIESDHFDNPRRWFLRVLLFFYLSGQDGISVLLKIIKESSNLSIEDAVLLALDEIFPSGAAEKLLLAMKSSSFFIREQASYILVKLITETGEKRIVEGLIEITKIDDFNIPRRARATLGRIKTGVVIETLLALTASENIEEIIHAGNLLCIIKAEPATPRILELMRSNKQFREELAARWSWNLSWMKPELPLDIRAELLKSDNESVRPAALMTPINIEDDGVRRFVEAALTDESEEIRNRANAILNTPPEADDSLPVLLDKFKTETEFDQKRKLVEQIFSLSRQDAYLCLLSLLESEDTGIFDLGQAVEMMGKFKSPKSLEIIKEHLSDDFAQSYSIRALEEIGDREAINILTEILHSTESKGRMDAFKSLCKLKEKETAADLIAFIFTVRRNSGEYDFMFKDSRAAFNELSDDIIKHGLLGNLRAEDPKVRQMAIKYGGYYAPDDDTYATLLEISNSDENERVRETAATAAFKLNTFLRRDFRPVGNGLPLREQPHYLAHCNLYKHLTNSPLMSDMPPEELAKVKSAHNHDDAHNDLFLLRTEDAALDVAKDEFAAWIRCNPHSSSAHFSIAYCYAAAELEDDAVAEYSEAIRLNPQNGGAHNNLAVRYENKFLYDEAEAEFRKAVSCEPQTILYRDNLANLLVKQGRPDEAVSEREEIVRIEPENTDYLDNLACLLLDLERLDEAEETFKKALELDADGWSLHNNIGLVYKRKNQLDEAEKSFITSIEKNPRDIIPHRNLIPVIKEKRSPEAVKEHYRTWMKSYPELYPLHLDYAEFLNENNELEEAVKVYREWFSLSPDDTNAYTDLINILERLKRFDEIETEYRKWIEKVPDDVYPRVYLAVFLIKQNRADEAVENFENWLDSHNDSYNHYYFALNLIENNLPETAEKTLLAACRNFPDEWYLHRTLANFYISQNREDAAEEIYRRRSEQYPEDTEVHCDFADLLINAGRLDEAESEISKALDIYKSTGNTYSIEWKVESLASLYWTKELYAEASALYSKAIEIVPDSTNLYASRGLKYWYQGSLTEALKDYNSVIKLNPESKGDYHSRGCILAELGDTEAAVSDLEKSIEHFKSGNQTTNLAYSLNGLGLALSKASNFDEALKHFEESIAYEPENAWVYFYRAICYDLMGELEKAVDNFILSLEKTNPDLPKHKRLYAQKYLGERS